MTHVEQWRNSLRLSDGTIDFGKLTMHHVDITMVDLSNDPWFDLDVNNYQNQSSARNRLSTRDQAMEVRACSERDP